MPIELVMRIIPHGDESKAYVAGKLYIENDGTGDLGNGVGIGNYNYRITGPVTEDGQVYCDEFWVAGALKGFDRTRGWWSCVKETLNNINTDYNI